MKDSGHERITDFGLGTTTTRSGFAYKGVTGPVKPQSRCKPAGAGLATKSGGEGGSAGVEDVAGVGSADAATTTAVDAPDTGMLALPPATSGGPLEGGTPHLHTAVAGVGEVLEANGEDGRRLVRPRSPLSAALSKWEHVSLGE